jgi:transposase
MSASVELPISPRVVIEFPQTAQPVENGHTCRRVTGEPADQVLSILDAEPMMRGPPKPRRLDEPIAVSLDALVPEGHVSRHLERALDLAVVREVVRATCAGIGRPSIDPVVFFTLHLILVVAGLRSERHLMRVVADRLSLRWSRGHALTEPLPHHSRLTRIRERDGLAVVRRFFEAVVEQCVATGPVWGKAVFIDSTDVAANAAIDSLQPRFAIEAHLAQLVEQGDGENDNDPDRSSEPMSLPIALTDETHTDLANRAADRHDWIGEMGRPIARRRAALTGEPQIFVPCQRIRMRLCSDQLEEAPTSDTMITTVWTAARHGSS